MRGLTRVIRDKNSNSLLVALLLAIGIANFIGNIANLWHSGGGQASDWTGPIYRSIAAFVATILVAWIIASFAKD